MSGQMGTWGSCGEQGGLSKAGISHATVIKILSATWNSHLAQLPQAQPFSNKPKHQRDSLRP